ncbi:hypothetical protein NQ318_018704 [Aromia moschata]|uniref:Uncharacterized protein n=1 Tax=Aromia moschata TaxID=1265417 RepID=A0AAV8ZG94_9CUCU|nr:hypothetical protein NQ318_018704 [Aromia moschata]
MALKFVVLVVFISMTDAGLIPAVEVLQGPSSRTTLVGPDGSTLAAAAPGGTVVTGTHPGGLVAASPLALAARCGDKTRTQKQVCEIFNTKYPDLRISQSTRVILGMEKFDVELEQSSFSSVLNDLLFQNNFQIFLLCSSGPDIVVAGPSGTIATSHTLAGPAIIPVAANTLLLGDIDSADGAYVPDNTEKLYDDGSYKGEQ